ncbi:MAG: hypothetical protein EBQ96_10040 [Proteobacteria bacterium]|nr:hypothetical protein [Pseudomonadota bacterium]
MIRVSYELVNEEEAEAGDTNRRGWCAPGGWRFNAKDEPYRYSLREMIDEIGPVVHAERTWSGLTLYGEAERNYETGDDETKAAHIKCSDASASRVLALLKRQRRI